MAENQIKSTVKSDKRQSEILIGVSLIIVGAIILYIALSQPKVVSKTEPSESASAVITVDESVLTAENSSSSSAKVEKDENAVVNINTCTPEELMQIPGIGESKANAIVAYRNVIGSYSSTEEVKNISGFGDKFYESIKDNITV